MNEWEVEAVNLDEVVICACANAKNPLNPDQIAEIFGFAYDPKR